MKVSLRIFRLSRKVVMIVGGVLLLSGVAGATALYIGKDKLLGSSEEAKTSDLECTNTEVVKIRRKDRTWIRKYIKMEPADGLTRVRTALRVAAAVFEKEKPDLVQVVVLDANGPTLRADMNGHAVGADVVYVPHPEKLASLEGTPVLQARYMDGMASAAGEFYGEKMHMPEDEAAHYMAALSEKTDCLDPPAPEGAVKVEGEGEAKKEGGEAAKEAKPAGEHGAAPAEAGGEGEAKPAEAEAKPAEGEAAGEAKAETAPAGAEKGWFASVKSMVFGDPASEKPETATAGSAEGEAGTQAKPSGEHGPAADASKAEGETPPAEAEAKPAEGDAPAEGHAKATAGAGENTSADTAPAAAEKGWFASVKSMVLGDPAAEKPDAAKAGDGKAEAAPAEEAKAEEGGKEAPATEGGGHAASEPPKLSEAEQAALDEKVQAEAETDARKQEAWLASIRNMVPPKAVPQANPGAAPAAAPAPTPDPSASAADHAAGVNGEAQQDPLQAEGQPHGPDKAPHGQAGPEVKAEGVLPPSGAHQPPPANPG